VPPRTCISVFNKFSCRVHVGIQQPLLWRTAVS
jgi:hypothetical protein